MTGRVHTFGLREGGAGRCVGRCDRRSLLKLEAVVCVRPPPVEQGQDAGQPSLGGAGPERSATANREKWMAIIMSGARERATS